MKVGIIGSGGREHSICHLLNSSKRVKQIYCFPGNAGTAKIAENVSLNLENFSEFKDFILINKIDLIIVGPEKPLVDGIVDFLEANNSDAETTSGRNAIDFLSNGFKCRTSYGDLNSNQTYIYMAFAEAPLVGTNNVPCTAR